MTKKFNYRTIQEAMTQSGRKTQEGLDNELVEFLSDLKNVHKEESGDERANHR